MKRNENAPYWLQLYEAERRIIQFALKNNGGSVAGAAAALGVSNVFVYTRCYKLKIGPHKNGEKLCTYTKKDRRRKADLAAAREQTP